jgi:hypothetical protein
MREKGEKKEEEKEKKKIAARVFEFETSQICMGWGVGGFFLRSSANQCN